VRELQVALRAAGLTCERVFAVRPSIDAPREFMPLSGFSDWFAPGHLLIAHRGAAMPPMPLSGLSATLRGTEGARGDADGWRLLRVSVSEKQKSIAFLEDRTVRAVIRVAHAKAARDAETHAHRMLMQLHSRRDIADLVPAVLGAGEIAGDSYFAESAVMGVPLASVIRSANRASFVPAVEHFLATLNRDTDEQPSAGAQTMLVTDYAEPLLARILPRLLKQTLRERTAALLEQSLTGVVTRVGVLHGDYGVSNIFVRGRRLTGVIDWENARWAAPAVLDAFNYLDSVHRHCGGGLTLADTIPLLARGDWPVPQELQMLQRAMARDGIAWHHHLGFALLYWLSHIVAQLEFRPSNEALTSRFEAVLSRLPA
jgi:aminoglycoside phosphotransferase